MGAALTLLVLLAGSIFIVRVASVALRITGLPEPIARFQSLSALSGAGFTTTESESIVNYPIRRKIIATLMLLGNLGLISVLSTFVVAFSKVDGTWSAITFQILSILGAIIFIVIIVTNKTVDRILCNIIQAILLRSSFFDEQPFLVLMEIEAERIIAEHSYRGSTTILLADILPPTTCLKLLFIRERDDQTIDISNGKIVIKPDDLLIFLGTHEEHHQLASKLKTIEDIGMQIT